MNAFFKASLLAAIFGLCGLTGLAQEEDDLGKVAFVTPVVGLSHPVIVGGIGFHAEVKIAYRVHPLLYVENALANNYTIITRRSGFWSYRNQTFANNSSALFGFRVYFSKDLSKKIRPYFSATGGATLYTYNVNGEVRTDLHPGVALGFYADINQYLVGISAENAGLVLKGGYTF